MIYVYDLDGTVIDSEHRKLAKADGSLDLEHWLENNTPEKIALDKLLPLADDMRTRQGTIVICTARILQDADYEFLSRHGLRADYVLSRDEGDMRPDEVLKLEKLSALLFELKRPFRDVEMWDDNKKVVAVLQKAGIMCHLVETK